MDFRDLREFLIDSSKYILIIGLVLLIGIFVISFQQVVGPSMKGTFEEKDVVMVSKLIYHFREPKRGEVVTLSKKEKVMIKRIIGLPGETISFKDHQLYVNGKAYKDEYANTPTADFELSTLGVDKIPEGYYFVLGDNRENSDDSRTYGLISKDEIIGRVFIRVFPFTKICFY